VGRDEVGDFYIEELDELELDPATPAPVARSAAPDDVAAPASPRLADRAAPPPRTAEEMVKAAFARQKEEAERKAAAELEAKRRVAAEARQRIEAARRAAEAREREEREAAERAAADRAAFRARGGAPSPPAERRPPRPRPTTGRPSVTTTDPMSTMLVERRLQAMLARLGDGIDVVDVYIDLPVEVIGPLWESHVVRALHEGDLATGLAAAAVREVIASRPVDLVAARVELGGEAWAVWADLDDDRVLAALRPAAVYLVGVG